MIIFQTDRLTIREFTASDADRFFSLQSNPDVMKYIRPPRTREQSDEFLFEKVLQPQREPFQGYWAIEQKDNGNFLGSFVIMPLPNEQEKTQLGYSLLPEYWGKGFATEATAGGIKYFYGQTPLDELFAVTEVPNTASQKVLLKTGFRFHKSFNENGVDLLLYHLQRSK